MSNLLTNKFVSDLQLGTSTKLYFFGEGLCLEVGKKSKVWRLYYYLHGKKHKITLGKFPIFDCKQANLWKDDTKKLVSMGISPAKVKDSAVLYDLTAAAGLFVEDYKKNWYPNKTSASKKLNFKTFAENWTKTVYSLKIKDLTEHNRMISKDIVPALGHLRLDEIKVADIFRLSDKIKARGSHYQALKTVKLIKRIFNHAVSRGYIKLNPANSIDMTEIGSAKNRTRVLEPKEISRLLKGLYIANVRLQYKLAFHLLMLTMVRKSELRLATWQEFDFEAGEWVIPAERMKKSRAFVVYLSSRALKLLERLKAMAGDSKWVLPAKDNPNMPIAESTLNYILKLVPECPHDFVPHDLRRTASTLLNENGYDKDWVEKALAHEQRGVRGVYNKAEYKEGRKEMLQWWADYVDKLAGIYL